MASEKLTPQTVLRRLPNLTVRIESDNGVLVLWENREMRSGARTLTVLDLFARPQTLAEAFDYLQAISNGAQDWIDLSASVMQLYGEGVLRSELEPRVSPSSSRFDSAELHVLMLNDRDRTSRLLSAIQETVRPGDIVLDIGTGTGVLAVAAARAGAKHVYAVEATSIGGVARTTFESNGLADRITLIEGWSTQIQLPERADVLVSEILGDDGLGERVLEVTLDARKRLLKPLARFVPRRIRVLGVPVTVPAERLNRHSFSTEGTQNWQSWYGIQFGALVDISRKYAPTIAVKPITASKWKFLAEPVLLAEINLSSFAGTAVEAHVLGTATQAGTVNGFILFFDTELSAGNWLSTDPRTASEHCSWRTYVQTVPTPFEIHPGDTFRVNYGYRAYEEGYNRAIIEPGGVLSPE